MKGAGPEIDDENEVEKEESIRRTLHGVFDETRKSCNETGCAAVIVVAIIVIVGYVGVTVHFIGNSYN